MPIVFDRKLNLSGLIGIILALGALGWNAYDWISGPSLKLIALNQVLFCRETQPYGQKLLRLGAISAYTNSASTERPATVISEWIKFKIGDHEFEQFAITRINANIRRILGSDSEYNSEACDPAEDGSSHHIHVTITESSAPFQVAGRGSVAHYSLFYPDPKSCPQNDSDCNRYANYLEWGRFLELIEEFKYAEVIVGANYIRKDSIKEITAPLCSIQISKEDVKNLAEFNFYAFVCQR